MRFVMKMWIFAGLAGACLGQSLTGTVIASDTGNPIAGATVDAVQQPASPGQRPSVYQTGDSPRVSLREIRDR